MNDNDHGHDRKSATFRFCFVVGSRCGNAVVLLLGLIGPLRAGESQVRFNRDIRPILAEHCLQCHGPDAERREGDLRLDRRQDAVQQAIVAGKPEQSELLRRVTSADAELRMPPPETGKSLQPEQIAALRQWIADGADYEGHWSFLPIRKPPVPEVESSVSTDIDRFLVARLNARGLRLSAPLSREQLIRRATFDLTGLPPTWDEVQAFVKDPSPRAFEKVVDRLLDSPRYGERWARHWLDIARYADTHGGSAIGFTRFPFSYTYRDYVIAAFNADKPYDRFVTEQLAADQLDLSANDPALGGLGFLTVGMQYRNAHDTIDDQIDAVTRGLLGLTVACARCHDHKYDAIPTTDYYALYATLASSHAPPMLPVLGEPPDTNEFREYRVELSRRQGELDDMAREQSAVMRSRLRMQVGLYLRELAKGVPEQDLSSAFLSYRTDDLRPLVLNRWRKYLDELPDSDPVFGPWRQLARMDAKDFAKQCQTLVDSLIKENGDLSQAEWHKLGANAPRWNPRVLESLSKGKPASLLEVADLYGMLLAEVHQQWLGVLRETSLEAQAETVVVPDEDVRHRDLNSPVNRQLRRHLYAAGSPTAMEDAIAVSLLNRPVHDKVAGLKGAIENLHLSSAGSPPRAMALREEKQPGEFHVFRRGSPIDLGVPVRARFLTAISPPAAKPFDAGKRRLGLAKAVVDADNPLTRRVIVNWVWQHHFGRGLVRTPDDFGVRGQPPTHPDLLDFLATRLLEDDWSLKRLHRRIMLTVAYQQGAVEDPASRIADPENQLLWRMPRRRLDLEAMRDAMLAVAGELDTTMGGRPFELAARPIVPRRSVYRFVNRDIVSSLASTFDGANPNACTARRPETNVPQQTLFALNSDFIQDRATALAALPSIRSAESDGVRIERLYQRVLSRSPQPQEREIALQYVRSAGKSGTADPWQRLAHVLLAANEFVFVD